MNFADLNTETDLFSYRHRSDGIHEYTFRSATPREVEMWVAITQHIKPFVVEHSLHVRSLYHMSGVLGSSYAMRKASETIRQLPKTVPTSTALLLDEGNIGIILIQMLLRQLPSRSLQSRQIFFNSDEAVRWLEQRRGALEAQGYWDYPIAKTAQE